MPKKSKGKHRLDKFYHLAKEQGCATDVGVLFVLARQHPAPVGEPGAAALTTCATAVQIPLPSSLQTYPAQPQVRLPDGMPVAAGSLRRPR